MLDRPIVVIMLRVGVLEVRQTPESSACGIIKTMVWHGTVVKGYSYAHEVNILLVATVSPNFELLLYLAIARMALERNCSGA